MKKHLISLVLIVSLVFAFIPKAYAEEIQDMVLGNDAVEPTSSETSDTNLSDALDGSDTDATAEGESDDDKSDEPLVVDEDENKSNETVSETTEEVSSGEEETVEPKTEVPNQEENLESENEGEVKTEPEHYEVTFTREGYKLVIPGGSSILLSQLNEKLGIDISLSEVQEIGISNEEVLSLVKVENSNDYVLKSLKSFTTEETLVIKTTTGYEYIIKVVDPVGDVPEHGKELTDNGDGTYTIALTVVGDSEKQVNKVNVIIVLDTSGSMDDGTGITEVTYTPTSSTSNGLYGLVNGEYVPLERRGNVFGRTFWYNNVQYTGQRYQRSSAEQDRMTAAKEAVNQIAESLLSNNGENGNPNDTVEMALVTFATNSNVRISKTTSYSTFSSTVNNLTANGGTNWEAALNSANGIDFGDDDQVYIIFVSDGNPTFRTTQNGFNDRYQNGIYGTGYEEEPNITRAYNTAVTRAQEIVNGGKKFYTIGAYGNVDRMEGLTTESGAPARNYYSAANTAELKEALGAILQEIEMAGIGAVSINDGTTSSVTTSSGVSHLLDVDTSSFKYYKDGEEWTDAPEATLNANGEVVWDLNEVGVLENDVEYKVTFIVWPSQTTLDLIADLKNDPSKYDTLDANIKKYLVNNGDGTYTLLTNTTASLSFKDTREENPQTHTEEYKNPDPVSTDATQMLTITKEWSNSIDEREKREIQIDILRDGESWFTLTLNNANNYQSSANIAVGIMTVDDNGEVDIKAEGHDFSFGELGSEAYNWELKTEIVRPMIVDGELKILVRQGTEEPTSGTYYKIGDYYYIVGTLDEGVAKLTATNERRSWIDLEKVVNYDESAAQFEDQIFTFEITVNEEGNEDIWFSVMDKATEALVKAADGLVVENATAETGDTGYFYATNGSTFKVGIKAGWNLRIINLLSGTTYTIKEVDLDSKFVFDDITYLPTTYVNEDNEEVDYEPTIDKDSYSVTGEVKKTNTAYGYTFENKNVSTEIVVTKVWNDEENKYNNRPDEIVLSLSNGTEVILQPDKVDNGDGTWTYTYKNLPVYNSDGELIEYTLTEEQVLGYLEAAIEGTAKDGYTVTNTLERIALTIVKDWDDNENQDGIRPDSLKVTLSDGTEVTLDEDGDWTATVEDLPKYKDKAEVEYTWSEEDVDGYNLSDTSESDGVTTLKNTHTPEKADVVVTKKWEDSDNEEGLRPDEISIHLFANGEEIEATPEIVKNEDNTWTFTYKDLDVYANGDEIEYTVTEDELENYETSIEGLTITNSREVEYVEIKTEKVWDDGENEEGFRPEEVTVNLLANGEIIDTVTLSDDNAWEYSWDSLSKYIDGKEVEYSLSEDKVNGYETTIEYDETRDKYIIINSREVETIDIVINKLWDDGDNTPGKRPSSITVILYANGEKVQTYEITENDNWELTIKGLNKYEDGEAIVYTIEEDDIPEYEGTITGDQEEGFTITNKFNGEIGDLEPPVTGIKIDSNSSIMSIELLMIILLGLAVILRKRENN